MQILKIFSRKWILLSILVALSMALFVRLGFWQLDRLAQKRAYNATMAERWQQEPFDLNAEELPQNLDQLDCNFRSAGRLAGSDTRRTGR